MTSVRSIKTFLAVSPVLAAIAAVALSVTFSVAHAQHNDKDSKETKEDIQRHRAMAAAHEGAAKCLESGKKDEVCEKRTASRLQRAGRRQILRDETRPLRRLTLFSGAPHDDTA